MRTLIWGALVSFSCLSLSACGDDDESANSSNNAGASGSAGTAGTAGTNNNAGAGGAPVTCDPPPPPVVNETAGGASGGASAGAAGSAQAGDAGATSQGGAAGQSSTGNGLSIVGSYKDSFDGEHVITNSQWKSGSDTFHISEFDNSAKFVVARNDQSNSFNPCLWSRFDWTTADGKLYFCTSAYAAESEAAAKATPAPDASDPAKGGCSSFPWSLLTPQ